MMHQVEIPVNTNSFKMFTSDCECRFNEREIIYKGEIPNENDTQ